MAGAAPGGAWTPGGARPPPSASADHPLDRRLQHDLVALVEDAVEVRDDAAIGLLGLALVRDLDLDPDGVALQTRGHDLHRAPEERHPGAVDESGLHDQALAEREGERAGRGASAEDGLPLDVLHVHE